MSLCTSRFFFWKKKKNKFKQKKTNKTKVYLFWFAMRFYLFIIIIEHRTELVFFLCVQKFVLKCTILFTGSLASNKRDTSQYYRKKKRRFFFGYICKKREVCTAKKKTFSLRLVFGIFEYRCVIEERKLKHCSVWK